MTDNLDYKETWYGVPVKNGGFFEPPTIAELQLHPGIMEVAEWIVSGLDTGEFGQDTLEQIVRCVVDIDRRMSRERRHQDPTGTQPTS